MRVKSPCASDKPPMIIKSYFWNVEPSFIEIDEHYCRLSKVDVFHISLNNHIVDYYIAFCEGKNLVNVNSISQSAIFSQQHCLLDSVRTSTIEIKVSCFLIHLSYIVSDRKNSWRSVLYAYSFVRRIGQYRYLLDLFYEYALYH